MKCLAACLGIVLSSMACDLVPVSAPEKKQLQQLRAGTHELVPIGTRVGRFQHFESGVRTWRFDTATGAVCLLLSSAMDWTDVETQGKGCK